MLSPSFPTILFPFFQGPQRNQALTSQTLTPPNLTAGPKYPRVQRMTYQPAVNSTWASKKPVTWPVAAFQPSMRARIRPSRF